MINKETYGNVKQILIGQDSYYAALPCVVKGTANSVIKAGQPLVGDITKRNTGFTKGTENAVGMLLHDVPLDSEGKGNGTIVFAAVVDALKLDSQVATDLKTANISRIIVVEGSAI